MAMYRTQILIELDQHKALAELARREGLSISELVREMIREQLAHRKEAEEEGKRRRLAALERIIRHREEFLARNGGKPIELDVVEMINQMREERDEQILGSILENRD